MPTQVPLMDDPELDAWLRNAGIADRVRGALNLRQLALSGMTVDLFASLLEQLERELGGVSDPDMALNNLERFFAASRSPLATAALFDREPTGIPILLKLFSASQYLADLLVRDTEAYDFLRMTEGLPHQPEVLLDDLASELRGAQDLAQAMVVIRRFKHRETLRIAFGDLIAEQRLPVVAEQISYVADAICEGAWQFCDRLLEKKFGWPLNEAGERIPFAILAMGKLGGSELNYSSDIDLVMVFGEHGYCAQAKSRSALEYYEELTRMFLRLVGENTSLGFAYRVDLRLRPDGKKGRLCNTLDSLLSYYELHGRPWERQALLKARPVAGDAEFGQRILQRLEPWIYSRHLNRFEIGEVKSLKRQIEKRALVEGVERRDIKTGHGGIRDIEFTIQFLQLLNGGGLPAVRTQNTLRAIERLQQAGILTLQEEALLTQNYAWLRKLEHRLQIMFDLQTHTLPDHEAELRKVALRMGYQEQKGRTPLEHFRSDLAEITAINRRILDHLLHAAFTDETETEVPPVVDLLFAPQPEAAELEQLLSPFGFRQARVAYDQLLAMAEEDSPFLPSRRCKHFLAAILPRLLKEIGQTPQPDTTIVSLRSVADALGAKGVLWELFHLQPNALALFVRLCAGADYLVSILRNNPGMIDELVDSLLMQGLPESEWLRAHLEDLLRGAEQLDPIIHSFRQAQQLRVGVQDLLGWAGVSEVTQALTAIADTCLERVARDKSQRLCELFGVPYLDVERRAAGYAILACGKQGGRELNYHSDLDLIFLYEGEGETQHANPDRQTSNQHFFSLWASEVTKFITHAGPYGRLYEIDARLRPTGKSGALAVSSEGLRRYFSSGQGQAWERLALCKSRVVVAEGLAQAGWEQLVSEAIAAVEWDPGVVDEIWQMRLRMQEAAPKWSLKRAAGGTVDVEFLVQLFLMRQMGAAPQMRTASTVDGLRLLAAEGFLQVSDAADLERAYLLLRSVETALRLSTEMPHVERVEQPEFLSKLTYLMRRDRAQQLLGEIDAARRTNRRLLEFYLDRLRG
ncbi:MAG: bifunctional [glutamate--ammonia ligase]-adenylyl-L-tyrosine phosphorylase/[glutamate--ammonia-ligase] adenylyltransferase [Planctomycetota bacterium]